MKKRGVKPFFVLALLFSLYALSAQAQSENESIVVTENTTTEIVVAEEISTTTEVVVETEPDQKEEVPEADEAQAEYKHSFSAHLTGDEIVPTPVETSMHGDAIFNVSMDERTIEYKVRAHGGSTITGIALACAKENENGPQITTIYESAGDSVESLVTGSIVIENILDGAMACTPNIDTVPHLVQAIREQSVYVIVYTSAYPQGEIRGQLNVTSSTDLPEDEEHEEEEEDEDDGDGDDGDGDNEGNDDNDNSGSRRRSTTSGSIALSNFGIGGGSDEGEVLGAQTGPMCSSYLTGYIKAGAQNDVGNVYLLQAFLNKYMNTRLTMTGVYDAATQAAVNQFQMKYHEEVLKPWVPYGLSNEYTPTGYVYKTTSRMITNIACDTTLPMPMLP